MYTGIVNYHPEIALNVLKYNVSFLLNDKIH